MIELTAPAEPFEQAGEGVEGLLEAWLADEGEPVRAGQPLADAIVVKTSFQIYAPCDGTLDRIAVPKGETFAAGAVLATIAEEAAAAEEPAPAEPSPAADTGARVRVPFTGMRGAVAREMALAWQAPRVAVGLEVDMTAALAALQAQQDDSNRLSPTHAVLRSVGLALREHPRLNARVTDSGVELCSEVNLGLAVSLEEGVIVPVIRHADRRSMPELAAEAGALAQAARDGSLPGAALREGTFTVSTLGAAGIDWFTPILHAPQVAILGVGRVTERVLARGGAAVVAPTVVLTLVFDHRAVDGQPAAAFLRAVADRLQSAAL